MGNDEVIREIAGELFVALRESAREPDGSRCATPYLFGNPAEDGNNYIASSIDGDFDLTDAVQKFLGLLRAKGLAWSE